MYKLIIPVSRSNIDKMPLFLSRINDVKSDYKYGIIYLLDNVSAKNLQEITDSILHAELPITYIAMPNNSHGDTILYSLMFLYKEFDNDVLILLNPSANITPYLMDDIVDLHAMQTEEKTNGICFKHTARSFAFNGRYGYGIYSKTFDITDKLFKLKDKIHSLDDLFTVKLSGKYTRPRENIFDNKE